jgi:alpha-pyrone synthase
MIAQAYVNRIATAVPDNDIHGAFTAYAEGLLTEPRDQRVFRKMAERSQIDQRWSCLTPTGSGPCLDTIGLYRQGDFPTTGARMRQFEVLAPALAMKAVEGLALGDDAAAITHLVVTCCTGFAAPGLDLQIAAALGLSVSVERTLIGFMGCSAAINALKLARHIVRSDAQAKVLLVSLELCTLHLQETGEIEQALAFLVFGDGCAAALISADPVGLSLDSFHAEVARESAEQITWTIRDQGFDMFLSGQVPASVGRTLRSAQSRILAGAQPDAIDLWAVHPGGRTVLDAVEQAFGLEPHKLAASRGVLHDHGNMSSGTVMFVLDRLMREAKAGQRGAAMSFGPGLVAETMTFRMAA